MRDFPEVIGQILLKQETEPKCVIQGGERLISVRESSETTSRDPPSSESGRIFSGYSRVLTEGHLEGHSSVDMAWEPQLDPQPLDAPQPVSKPQYSLPQPREEAGLDT